MTIRRARSVEADAILALWAEAMSPPSVTDSADVIHALLERSDTWLLVAEENGERAGTLIVAFDGWRGHFYRLAVLPRWRRRGIGLQLVREGERLLREAGAQRIAAIVLTDRDPAMGFWAAAGYELQVEATRFTKLV